MDDSTIDRVVTPDNVALGHTWLKRKLKEAFALYKRRVVDDIDDPDLTDATLLCDSALGVYIPQRFAQEINRSFVSGVADKDWLVLEAGPSNEYYWDAWADALDNAKVTDPKLGKCYLHQDGDLWMVPVEKVKKKEGETLTILGIKFRKMEVRDYDGFAGADEGSYIAESDKAVLIYSPTAQSISEIGYDETSSLSWQHDWNMTKIL